MELDIEIINMELALSDLEQRILGADDVIDYAKVDFTVTGETYDIIFDAVGKSSFSRCKIVTVFSKSLIFSN